MSLPARFITGALAISALAGCSGEQAWIDPHGEDAETVATLFWVMLSGAVLIWTAVIGLAIYASRIAPEPHSARGASRLIIWGGIVAPTVTIAALLVAGLLVLDEMTDRSADLTLAARGERWWWRIAHEGPGGEAVPTPNELRLPVGATAEITLTANRVIHSFWVPSLGGKVDMIPGRETRIHLTPTETGVFRGQCAEYCGGAHAQMAFPVVVMEPEAFDAWLARQAEPAAAPADGRAEDGMALFLSAGCGACHTVRGTEADGLVGPDLTHVGSRLSIGAGVLPMTAGAMARWIAATEHVKPGVRMPQYGMLPDDEIRLIAEYLVGLE